jgi:hypothetical protein
MHTGMGRFEVSGKGSQRHGRLLPLRWWLCAAHAAASLPIGGRAVAAPVPMRVLTNVRRESFSRDRHG